VTLDATGHLAVARPARRRYEDEPARKPAIVATPEAAPARSRYNRLPAGRASQRDARDVAFAFSQARSSLDFHTREEAHGQACRESTARHSCQEGRNGGNGPQQDARDEDAPRYRKEGAREEVTGRIVMRAAVSHDAARQERVRVTFGGDRNALNVRFMMLTGHHRATAIVVVSGPKTVMEA